ncbi:MAG: Stk1 family PASTA domain-containing Ser/Thr kinase, partial [Coriobacteriales bacterium]|nr:Stk1 family PASTA domain-containing Ser/Thr kinase [Coriobacteriales bacterium]
MASRTLGGRYTVQDKIGTGGMAIVYRGVDDVLGRTVAIKTMLPQYANDQSFAARFKQEAQAAAALQSPYIVSVYDWGKDSDTYYIIMEYLRGTDLKSGIRKHGALDCRKVAQIGSQISQALSVAHRHDIIHRDIKPQNIMVQPDGNVKVMDFGIARAKNSHLTADNSVLGTAHYVSPEQTQGQDLGPTTDIYSLGIVMYEAATGRVPFDGDDAISVALKQVNDPPLPPSQINPRVDAALESVILKCMQKRPEDRFQTADELYRVLRDYLAGKMQSVSDAAAVGGASVATNRMQRTGPQGYNGMGDTGTGSETGAHYRAKSATEEDQDRRHKRNVIVGAVASVLIIAGIALAVFLLMGRQQTRTVPNLIGLTQEDAIAQIKQSNYFTEGSIKEQYSDKVAKGEVVDQDPDPGKGAAQGTAIDLVISKGEQPAQEVTVPDLIGLSPSEAEKELSKMGLKGQAGDSVYSDEVENGKVAAQDPKSNTSAKAGETVTYQLSKGGESVEVPNVIGWSQAEATSALENAGFSVIVNSESSENYRAGLVCYQSATGTATKGSEVIITVSTGTAKIAVPSVVGMNEGDATSTLNNAGFDVTTTDVESTTVPAGNVVWQSTTGSADRGTSITIGVSIGSSTTNNTDNNNNGNN